MRVPWRAGHGLRAGNHQFGLEAMKVGVTPAGRTALLVNCGLLIAFAAAALVLGNTVNPPFLGNENGTIYSDPREAARVFDLDVVTTLWFCAVLATGVWYIWVQRARENRSVASSVGRTLIPFLVVMLGSGIVFVWQFGAINARTQLALMAIPALVASSGLLALLAAIVPRSQVIFLVVGTLGVLAISILFFAFLGFSTFCC